MAAKKNPWSDDSGSDSELAISLDVGPVVPKEKAERKAKAAVKYNLYSSSEDEFDCGLSSPKKAASVDDGCFVPEANSAIDSEADSPPPKAPEPKKLVKSNSVTVSEAKSKSSSQSDGDDAMASMPPAKPKAAPKKTAAPKKMAIAKKKPADAKQPSIMDALSKPKSVSKTAAKKVPSFDSSSSEGSPNAPAPSKAAPAKRKALDSDDSDRSSDDLMSRIKGKKTTVASKKTKVWDDESFHISDEEVVAPRSKAVRAKKPVAYNFDSDSDEDF